MTTQFKLHDTLHRHKKTPAALVQASGLAKTTVYNIVNNKAKAVELATLDKLLLGLQKLTQENFGLEDILETKQQDDWRKEIFRNAKPFDWEAVQALLPEWTEEEQIENEAFLKTLEEQRELDRKLSEKRLEMLTELVANSSEPVL